MELATLPPPFWLRFQFLSTCLSASFWIASLPCLGLETLCAEANEIYSNWRDEAAALELEQWERPLAL